MYELYPFIDSLRVDEDMITGIVFWLNLIGGIKSLINNEQIKDLDQLIFKHG